ncbi:hypothetical protein ACJRO7_033408 [Eucalyptus globulus]|uniref:Uncharacterized protein n=1 Tax=Eucalyptus globulus TaxID=34317 RepID=A0ABD3JL92_EUCGL
MKRLWRIARLFIFWVLVSLHTEALSTDIGDGSQKHAKGKKEKLSIAKIVIGTVSLLIESHKISWIKIKTIMNSMQLQFFPPDLNNAGPKVKWTVKKSFGTNKVTVKETAKSTAEVAGKAVRKMVEKVKERMSDEQKGEELKTHNLADPKLSRKMHSLGMTLGCATTLSTEPHSKQLYNQKENLSKH